MKRNKKAVQFFAKKGAPPWEPKNSCQIESRALQALGPKESKAFFASFSSEKEVLSLRSIAFFRSPDCPGGLRPPKLLHRPLRLRIPNL
jgi:hypothetical protein